MDNFKILGREDNNMARTHQRSHVHQGQQPNPEQEHWEVQPPTYMG